MASESKRVVTAFQLDPAASEGALVDALLAFANGGQVAILVPGDAGEVVQSWSFYRARPTQDERASHAGLLQQLIEFAAGARPLPALAAIDGIRLPLKRIPPLYQPADEVGLELLPDQDFFACLEHMHTQMDRVLIGRARSISYVPLFGNVAAALTFACMLVMDPEKPFWKALCRCRLPRCARFFLSKQNPKGGPPARSYCEPGHGEEHHNSAERAAARKRAETTRRKHK